MNKRNKQRPTWITDKVEEEVKTCKDCEIEFQCAILKEVNRISKSKGGNNVNHEWGCNYLTEKGK